MEQKPDAFTEAAMILWEAITEPADDGDPVTSDLLDLRANGGSAHLRAELMWLARPLVEGWEIHQAAAGDDVILPYDTGFAPAFLSRCAVVNGDRVGLRPDWRAICADMREGDE